jgi:tetratricopeptide (TPR) repeat protein
MAEEEKIRRLKKLAIIAMVIVAALVGASYLVYGLLQSGRVHPLALLVLAAVISIAIPMIRNNFFPSDRDCATEYAFHEKRLEKEIIQQISDTLGPDTLNHLFSQPDQYRTSAGKHVEQLLAQDNVRQNPDLHFTLLLSLARFHEKNGDPQSSIPLIKAALAIKPQQFVARMHLAGNYEWIGAAEEARRQYRTLLEHPETLSGAMKKMVAARINRIQEE